MQASRVVMVRRLRQAAMKSPLAAGRRRDAQIARLQKEKAKLERELAKARFVVDVQSKLQALLETISEGADNEPGSSS
jgi:transposase